MTRTRSFSTVLLLAAALPLAACGGSDPLTSSSTKSPSSSASDNDAATGGATGGSTGMAGDKTVTVGSADFPEAALLGEIYAQALEADGFTVTRKFNIGSRETYLKAITGGEVDLLPEYTGSLLNYYDKAANVSTPDEVYAALEDVVPGDLTVLEKSAAEDKNSIAVTAETASSWSLQSIGDLAAYQGELSIAAPPEFKDRQQGLAGLKSVYNVTPAQFRPLASQAAVQALANGQVKAANIFSTDPAIATNGFVVLEDPQALFGSDNVVPLVRKDAVSSELETTLDEVSSRLDTSSLADMVKQVVTDKKDVTEVAKSWLNG